ncbi:45045_t:CDS:1, partial [Gigaspora margarita]
AYNKPTTSYNYYARLYTTPFILFRRPNVEIPSLQVFRCNKNYEQKKH